MIILGMFLIALGFSEWSILLYGIPSFVLGIFILFHKNEDYIEKIKTKPYGGKKIK